MSSFLDSPTGEAVRDPNYASAQVIEIPNRWASVGSPWSLVQDRFTVTSDYAATSYNATQGFIDDVLTLVKQLETFNVPSINVASPEVPSIDYNARPKVGDLDINTSFPVNTAEKPVFVTLPTITPVDIPIFNIPAPDINLPDTPEDREVSGPGDAPAVGDVVLPVKPGYTMPDLPVLQDILLPSAPSISIPEFDSNLPDEVFENTDALSWQESPFNSDIWNALLTKTMDGIVNGGTGLDPAVESQIWERALLRQQGDDEKAYEEIEKYHSSKGWDMPQGALAGALQEKSDEISRNRRLTNIDIAVKQAELAQNNTQFMMQMGKDAELILRDFHNAQMNRGLEAAKAVATNAIEILNAKIAAYNGRIDKYKADAAVYGERVKAALIQVEIFKSQIEGVKVSAEVQKNLVDIYEAQIGAIETTVKIYTAEMEGAKVQADIEAQKISIFKTRVDAYVAEIGAEKVKYETYGIAAGAEKVKAEVFSEQVTAFTSQVQAKKVELEVQEVALNAGISKNQSEIERYKAELSAYAVELDAASKKVGAIVEAYKGEVAGYSAETNAEAARFDAVVAEIGARIEEAKFNLQKAVAEVESTTEGYMGIKKLQMDGINGVSGVSAQLAASAMNAVSASASYGYSGSESIGTSFNYGASSSENHSFSHPTRQLS